jgi:hypothetical protein
MAKGNKAKVQIFTNARLPRIVARITRSLECSSPAPGRPKVWWTQGINPEIVREHWPADGEFPYEERQLPLHIYLGIWNAPKTVKCYPLGLTKKMIVYERMHPEIRLVLVLGAPNDSEGETWQPIMQSRVERDRGVDPRQSRARQERLWDEVCRVERRGRPRGAGHPKQRATQYFPIPATEISRLRKSGLDDKDLQILFGRWQDKTLKEIGQELGISAQAVQKRWQRRIEPRLKQVNPRFATKSFRFVR